MSTFPTALPAARTPDPMQAPPLRWGVIGPGWIAERFISSIRGHTRQQVLAVGSRDLGRSTAFAQKHGAWIAARLKKLPHPAPFAHGLALPLRGEPHRIEHRRLQPGRAPVEFGLFLEELVEIILPGRRIERPGGAAEEALPVVGRPAIGRGVPPDVPVAVRVVAR